MDRAGKREATTRASDNIEAYAKGGVFFVIRMIGGLFVLFGIVIVVIIGLSAISGGLNLKSAACFGEWISQTEDAYLFYRCMGTMPPTGLGY